VIIDEKICWKPHIKYIKTKLSKSIVVLARAKHILKLKSLRNFYCSLLLPHLNCCVEVWGSTYLHLRQPLVIMQKRALRVIHNVGFRDHTNALFLQSKLLKTQDLIEYQIAVFMFKARNSL